MGKRKRRVDINKVPPHSDTKPCAPQVDPQSEQKSSGQAENKATRGPHMDATTDGSHNKKSSGHNTALTQNHSSSHKILLRHSCHPFGRHYSRRSSTNYSDASPSSSKGYAVYDSKLSFKSESKDLQALPYRERTFQKPERIRSNTYGDNTVSGDVRKMECRICQKRLRKHPFFFQNSLSSNDLSVVAVLVCGHAYHADCLERKTRQQDIQDPPCPLCVGPSYAA